MRILLLGFGTVGQSLAEIVRAEGRRINQEYGLNPRFVGVVDRRGAALCESGLDLDRLLDVKKKRATVSEFEGYGHSGMAGLQAIREAECEVVIDATPTNIVDGEPGMSHIIAALRQGRHVVTVNKGPLALALPALREMAEYNGVLLKFSGTVGGGTPILAFSRRCLSMDRILRAEGILNGTTNFVLTKMEAGLTFDSALAEAQRLGYAEADPSLDIDGIDTALKLVILANWIRRGDYTLKDVKVSGIRGMSIDVIKEANRRGSSIKLLAKMNEDLVVAPTEIPRSDPLCVMGTLNAAKFVCEHAGDEIIIGRGAGGYETACAVLRDLLEVKEEMAGGGRIV